MTVSTTPNFQPGHGNGGLFYSSQASYSAPLGGGGGLTLPQVASATLLLDLRASQLALNDGDPVSTWADASGNGNDFTQSGTARPTYRAGGGVPYIEFDQAQEQWLLGTNFADNLNWFAVFASCNKNVGSNVFLIGKMNPLFNGSGWCLVLQPGTTSFICEDVGGNDVVEVDDSFHDNAGGFAVYSCELLSLPLAQGHLYVNGDNSHEANTSLGPVVSFSTTEPVRIGSDGVTNSMDDGQLRSLLIYQINAPAAWSATDRAAIEAWLATNP